MESRGFCHQFAFALPFDLASTHAGVWQYRPAVTLSGRLTPLARDPAPRLPPASPGRCISPGPAIPAGTDETSIVLHLLSHGASWRTVNFHGFAIRHRPSGDSNSPRSIFLHPSAIDVALRAGNPQLAPVGERVVLEKANGAREGGALDLLARTQLRLVRPPSQLAMRGELQGLDLLAGQARRQLVAHRARLSSNSMARSRP
jgi:hypothetical protein